MAKRIPCDYKCKFNCTKCNLDSKWNTKACHYKCKNYHEYKIRL